MSALDWSQCPAVESVTGKVSGAWVFRGTRTPVATIFENLEDGMTIDEVMDQFPVTRAQVTAVLQFAARSLYALCPAAYANPLRQRDTEPDSSKSVISFARQIGWHELKNGELLAQAEAAGFDLLLTSDKNRWTRIKKRGFMFLISSVLYPCLSVVKFLASRLCVKKFL